MLTTAVPMLVCNIFWNSVCTYHVMLQCIIMLATCFKIFINTSNFTNFFLQWALTKYTHRRFLQTMRDFYHLNNKPIFFHINIKGISDPYLNNYKKSYVKIVKSSFMQCTLNHLNSQKGKILTYIYTFLI